MSALRVTRRELVGFVEQAIRKVPDLVRYERTKLRHVARTADRVYRVNAHDSNGGCPANLAGLWSADDDPSDAVTKFAFAFDDVTRHRALAAAGPEGAAHLIEVVHE